MHRVSSCEIGKPEACREVVNQCGGVTLHEIFIQLLCKRCFAAGCLQCRYCQFSAACWTLADALFEEVFKAADGDSLCFHQAGEFVMFSRRPIGPEDIVKEKGLPV